MASTLNLPLAFYVIAIFLLIWFYVSSMRYGKFLYAVGGKAEAAYETAVPVTMVQFNTYVISGLMAAFSGIAITMLRTARSRSAPSVASISIVETREITKGPH